MVTPNNLFDKNSEKLLISALTKKINLSVEERIESHENARELLNDLSTASKDLSARSKEAS
jgi:hypothetical protein